MAKNITSVVSNKEALSVLRQFTRARIALGRAGTSLPIKANLDFQLAHALARDSVSLPLDFDGMAQQLSDCYETLQLQSQVESHSDYLQRPDKGRLLNAISQKKLQSLSGRETNPDIALIIADGLSSKAIENHAPALLLKLIPELLKSDYSLAPLSLVKYARVAIGDPIGELFNARMSIVLIGERPGLSSPDSMGIYFTYHPQTGNTDAQRNCISNIHSHGLNYLQAVRKLLYLINAANRLEYSGVRLKETAEDEHGLNNLAQHSNFLLE